MTNELEQHASGISSNSPICAESTIGSPTLSQDQEPISCNSSTDAPNPRSWSPRRKYTATLLVSLFGFVALAASTMISPALPQISSDLHVGSSATTQLSMSAFILCYGVGALFWAPMAEEWGRRPILLLSNALFLICNLVCGFAISGPQLVVLRLVGGFGASSTTAIMGGVSSDLFEPSERGRGIATMAFIPLLGPALGPLVASAILSRLSWRWIFHITTILEGLFQLLGICFLQETYAPVLLGRKKQKMINTLGRTKSRLPYDKPDLSLATRLGTSFARPWTMLLSEPIVVLVSIYMAWSFGVLYIFLSMFPEAWRVLYGQPVLIGGLHYVAWGLGEGVGSQLGARLQDLIYRRLSRRACGKILVDKESATTDTKKHGKPEHRLPLLAGTAFLQPMSLILFGWSAQYQVHWIVPDIATIAYGIGYITGWQCLQAYIIDCYPRYAASASGAIGVLRCVTAFGFPVFAPAMIHTLDWG